MKPIILQGHSRPIKDLKFNRDGDLLFSGSNDRLITLWASETGERIGTFLHSAAVNTMAVTNDSKILVSGDSTGGCYFWEISTGSLLKKIEMDPTLSIRSVDLSLGEQLLTLTYSGRHKESQSVIDIYSIPDILASPSNTSGVINIKPLKSIVSTSSKYVMSKWINLNKNIVCSREDGIMQLIDYKTSEVIVEKQVHSNIIMDFDICKKEEIILTASKDGKSCIIDPDTFDVIHTLYPQDPTRNLNSCKISPLFSLNDENEEKYHAIVAGGQESRDVTTTHAKKGGFEILIYNIMYGDELGAIQGHFGPVNTLAFSPNGKLIASGGEDATIRVHKLDEEYQNLA
jgi:translation initiation factor 3 subunit I